MPKTPQVTMEWDEDSIAAFRKAVELRGSTALLKELKPVLQGGAKEIKSIAKSTLKSIRRVGKGRHSEIEDETIRLIDRAVKIGTFVIDKRDGLVWAAVGIEKGASDVMGENGKPIKPANEAEKIEFGHATKHSAVEARPFMRPAFDSVAAKLLATIEQTMAKVLGV